MSEQYEIPYPFFEETVEAFWIIDKGDMFDSTMADYVPPKVKTWRPGVSFAEYEDQYGSVHTDAYADGMGHMLLTVIQRTAMPKPYQGRVFYTRQWRDPAGKVFGNKKLRIATTGSFNRLLKGYRHPFDYEPRSEIADADA